MIRKVCIVSREMEGVAEAGGLKDAVRGIADALSESGIETTVVLPLYGFVEPGEKIGDYSIPVNGQFVTVSASARFLSGIRIILLSAEAFQNKKAVYTYTEEDAPSPELIGKGHLDVHQMNVLLQSGAVRYLLEEESPPDIIHGHDGHTGLLPLYIKPYAAKGGFFERTGVLITIHNAGEAYQQALGSPERTEMMTGLSQEDLRLGLLNGKVNPLLIAGIFAEVNTVSPGYAREIISKKDQYTGGLGAAYRNIGLRPKGITNGIDPRLWGFCASAEKGKSFHKENMRREITAMIYQGLPEGIEYIGACPDPSVPWVLFHNRFTEQKGMEELLGLPIVKHTSIPYAMIVYGQGDPVWEDALEAQCDRSDHWTFFNGYDKDWTNRLFCASSFVIVPSLWEPCGQIDMIGQLSGALPIVRRVGGLKKIRHFRDGFSYSHHAENGLGKTLEKALWLEDKAKTWVWMMRRHAENIVYGKRSWRKVLVRGYLPLYRKAIRNIRHLRSFRHEQSGRNDS